MNNPDIPFPTFADQNTLQWWLDLSCNDQCFSLVTKGSIWARTTRDGFKV